MYVVGGLVIILLAVVYLFSLKGKQGEIVEPETVDDAQSEIDPNCCGAHEVCDKTAEEMLVDASKYYEDEELDRFSNQCIVEFDDRDVEEFRDVLYTLKRNEISSWLSSLEFRKITPPGVIRDEAMLLMQD